MSSLPSAMQVLPFTPQTASSSSLASINDDRLVLCIGGQILQTSRKTLCMDEDSMLAAWVLRHLPLGNHMLWIDRDANRFHHVLNYLRNGTIWLDDVASLRAVQEEAAFFGLTGLENLCKQRIQALCAREEALRERSMEELQNAVKGAVAGFCMDSLVNFCSKDEVVAVLRGRRIGNSKSAGEPVFRMDEDF